MPININMAKCCYCLFQVIEQDIRSLLVSGLIWKLISIQYPVSSIRYPVGYLVRYQLRGRTLNSKFRYCNKARYSDNLISRSSLIFSFWSVLPACKGQGWRGEERGWRAGRRCPWSWGWWPAARRCSPCGTRYPAVPIPSHQQIIYLYSSHRRRLYVVVVYHVTAVS